MTLYQGDALEVLRELPDDVAASCVTSPPYLTARPEYGTPTPQEFEAIFRELWRVVSGPLALNVGRIWRDGKELLWWTDLLERAQRVGWQVADTLIWIKPNANPIHGGVLANSHEYVFLLGAAANFNVNEVRRQHAPSTVARFGRGWTNHRGVKQPRDSRARKTRAEPNPLGARPRSYVEVHVGGDKGNEHPAPMARLLAEHLVKLTTVAGETVLDPFAGSGTTCTAARTLGRHSIGIDLNAEYLEMAARRLQQQSLFA